MRVNNGAPQATTIQGAVSHIRSGHLQRIPIPQPYSRQVACPPIASDASPAGRKDQWEQLRMAGSTVRLKIDRRHVVDVACPLPNLPPQADASRLISPIWAPIPSDIGVSTFALSSGWRGLRGGRLLQVAQHRLTQDGVDAGLVALAVTLEPSHYILVDTD